jgi:hypothetical protein
MTELRRRSFLAGALARRAIAGNAKTLISVSQTNLTGLVKDSAPVFWGVEKTLRNRDHA